MDKEYVLEILNDIRREVWDRDIPSPTVPEYVEHHKDIQDILKFIDDKMEEVLKL